jgi:hypothetical protein
MGTRSRIGVMHGDKCKSVYCHWDGYLSHNGKILQEHYDSAKANHLVALGDIGSLGKHIGEAHPFSQFDIDKDDPDFDKLIALHELAEKEDWTTFYARDRGEKDVDFEVSHDFDEFLELCDGTGAEYYYIMRDGVWYCGSLYSVEGMIAGGLYELNEQLAKQTV